MSSLTIIIIVVVFLKWTLLNIITYFLFYFVPYEAIIIYTTKILSLSLSLSLSLFHESMMDIAFALSGF